MKPESLIHTPEQVDKHTRPFQMGVPSLGLLHLLSAQFGSALIGSVSSRLCFGAPVILRVERIVGAPAKHLGWKLSPGSLLFTTLRYATDLNYEKRNDLSWSLLLTVKTLGPWTIDWNE